MLQKLPMLVLLALAIGRCAFAAEPIHLTTDPHVSVVELWYLDGDPQPQPQVALFADGRVWCRCVDAPQWGQITRAELTDVVNGLLVTCNLARIDSAQLGYQIQQESVRTGLTAEVPGAAETFIRIRTVERTYEVRCPAVGVLSPRFPEVSSLRNLFHAQRRIENVRAVAMAGGSEAAARLARLAQASVANDYGEAIAVTPRDLALVRFLPDGGCYCQFLITEPSKDPHQARIISLFDTPGDVPRVTMLGDGPTLR